MFLVLCIKSKDIRFKAGLKSCLILYPEPPRIVREELFQREKMKIRLAKVGDEQEITRINVETWHSAYQGIIPAELLAEKKIDDRRISNWRKTIETAETRGIRAWVAEDGAGKICGYLTGGKGRDNFSDYNYEIYALYVHPEKQKQGIGRMLVDAFRAFIGYKPFYLFIAEGNLPATIFYERLGGVKNEKLSRTLQISGCELKEECFNFQL